MRCAVVVNILVLCYQTFQTSGAGSVTAEDVLVVSTYASLIPNKSSYRINDFISECVLYSIVVNQAGISKLRSDERKLRFKIEISLPTSMGLKPIYESVYTHRSLMPLKVRELAHTDAIVSALCLSNDRSLHRVAVPIEGLIGAVANVQDMSVVHVGQEIDCSAEANSGARPFWLYYNGEIQASSMGKLKITNNALMTHKTPYSSYACCAIGAGGRRRIYTYFVATYFTHVIAPTKSTLNPGEIVTCHIFISTLADVGKASEALTNVGIRVTTRLMKGNVRIYERLRASTIILPDYAQKVKGYKIQCLLNGEAKTREYYYPAKYQQATYIEPYRITYLSDTPAVCKNLDIYGDRVARLVLVEIPNVFTPTPTHDNAQLTTSYVEKVKNVRFVVIKDMLPSQEGNLYAMCEISRPSSIYYTTPIPFSIRNSNPVRMQILFPTGVPISRVTYLTPGALLKCETSYPKRDRWGHVAGNIGQCGMEVFSEFLRVPSVTQNCVAVYSCRGYANSSRIETADLRLTFEVLANFHTVVAGTQAYMTPGQKVSCHALGYSELAGDVVTIPLDANLWFSPSHKAPQNLDTAIIPSVIVPGSYHVDCRERPGAFSEFIPLVTSSAVSAVIQYFPDEGQDLYVEDVIECFITLPVDGQEDLMKVRGLIFVQVQKGRSSLLVANRTNRFPIPEFIVFEARKTPVYELRFRIGCDVRGFVESTWDGQVVSCDGRIRYVEISPAYSETVGIGTRFGCVTEARCARHFRYELTISSSASGSSDDSSAVVSYSKPIKITYNLLGTKTITCLARGEGSTVLRDTRQIMIEGQPSLMTVTCRTRDGYLIEGSSDSINANETMRCSCGGYPIPEIQWVFVEGPKEFPKHQLTTQEGDLITSISDPSGYYTYVCHAKNKLGKVFLKHTFYLRNIYHTSNELQTIVFYWMFMSIAFFLAFLTIGYFVINSEFLRAAESYQKE